MADAALEPWTVDAFFAWQERQEDRYELVGGRPLLRAHVTNLHDRIVVNVICALHAALRGGPFRTFTSGGSIETYPGQIRRPDLGIDCGRRDPDAYTAAEPRMVAEVLSPSTRDFDTIEKLAEYKAVETLDHIVYVEPNAADVIVWCRGADRSWERFRFDGLEAVVEMPALGFVLPLAEIYDGVTFPTDPRLTVG